MAYTDINSEDRLVQQTFSNHLRDALGIGHRSSLLGHSLGLIHDVLSHGAVALLMDATLSYWCPVS